MPEDHLRFRCYRCNQLLGVSSKRAGTVISCPKWPTELKVPLPEEQSGAADASRPGQVFSSEPRLPENSSSVAAKPGSNALPTFMEEIAAAIPDDLATLRPEDIRVEAEFVDLVVTTSESVTASAPAAQDLRQGVLPGDPVKVEAYFAQTPAPAETPSAIPAEPRPVDPPRDSAVGADLAAINIETPSLRPPASQFQNVSEVILQPATVLAWSLLVLFALPMAFLAGLLMGHFVWK